MPIHSINFIFDCFMRSREYDDKIMNCFDCFQYNQQQQLAQEKNCRISLQRRPSSQSVKAKRQKLTTCKHHIKISLSKNSRCVSSQCIRLPQYIRKELSVKQIKHSCFREAFGLKESFNCSKNLPKTKQHNTENSEIRIWLPQPELKIKKQNQEIISIDPELKTLQVPTITISPHQQQARPSNIRTDVNQTAKPSLSQMAQRDQDLLTPFNQIQKKSHENLLLNPADAQGNKPPTKTSKSLVLKNLKDIICTQSIPDDSLKDDSFSQVISGGRNLHLKSFVKLQNSEKNIKTASQNGSIHNKKKGYFLDRSFT